MKNFVLSALLAGLSVCLAGEFLGVVPGAVPEDLAAGYTVVGRIGRGVLVVGDETSLADFGSLGGVYLAASPRDHLYYTVRLFADASRSDLAATARILDFDGSEYLVEVEPDAVEEFITVPAMRGRVSLNGWVMNKTAPELPRIFSDPAIEQLVARVSPDTVLAFVRRLQDYRSRYSTGDSCRAACDWVAQKFRDWGCDTVVLQPHRSGHAPNVIGIRYGTSGQRNPYAILSGHIDSYAASNAPGADDNASGTAATMEGCRVTQGSLFTHDLRFIAWTGEEFGLYGSEAYADSVRVAGDSILGVINFDMIGYEDAAPEDCNMMAKISNPPCEPFCDWFIAVADTYTALPCAKQMMNDNQNSDHGPFWNNGYLALTGIEDFWPTNPHYHTSHDSIGAGYNNNAFCTEVTRAGVAALATLGEPAPLNAPSVGLLRTRLDDVGGNNNGNWDAGESVAVYLTLKNFGMVGATNVSATVSTADPYVTLCDTSAAYGNIAALDTAVNSVPYTMKAAANTPREHMASFNLAITSTESTWQTTFAIQIGEYLTTDPVPDGPRTPPLYWAYDDVDTLYAEHPEYDWVEINGLGTQLSFAQNDDVTMISIPSGFGPLKFYGQRYTQMSISADGWIACGNYTNSAYSNTALPNSSAPRATMFLNWDDLKPESEGNGYVYYYHDAANHRFIVEYDSVQYYSGTARDKFEVVIYDTTVVTSSGDNVFVMQYQTAAGLTNSTVGIQDPTQTIAIQDLYNGTPAHGAAPITAGRAVKYTTTPAVVVEEPTDPTTHLTPRLTLDRNPVGADARIRFTLRSAARVDLGVFDRGGRRVATLVSGPMPAGSATVTWDARHLAAGVYFVRLTTPDTNLSAKAVVTF